MCMQASPAWLLANLAESYNISLAQFTEIFDNLLGQTEACLALDVYVPEGIFNNRIATKGNCDRLHVFFPSIKPPC